MTDKYCRGVLFQRLGLYKIIHILNDMKYCFGVALGGTTVKMGVFTEHGQIHIFIIFLAKFQFSNNLCENRFKIQRRPSMNYMYIIGDSVMP